MRLTDQRFERSNADLRQAGYLALIDAVGYADAIRFLAQVGPGHGDYLQWQDEILADMSVDELFEQAQRHWKRQGK